LGLADDFILQHDNAACHTSKLTKNWLNDQGIQVLPWAPQSPDMNPIENLFSYVRNKLGKEKYTTIEEMKEKISEIWYNIPVVICRNLIDSL
ncbi:putative Mariner transposable element, partial [Pseudoloma neurophilia]